MSLQRSWREHRHTLRNLASATLGVGLAWLAVNLVPLPAPEPLWTEVAPVAGDNHAWESIAGTRAAVEWPEALPRSLVSAKLGPRQAWKQAEAHHAELAELVARPALRELVERVAEASERGAFIEDCPSPQTCTVFTWHQDHRLVLTAILVHAQAGALDGAALELRGLLRLDLEFATQPASTIGLLVGLSHLQASLDLAAMLVDQGRGRDTPGLRALRDELRALEFDLDAVSLERLVRNEYVSMLEIVDDIEAGESTLYDGPASAWLFSRGPTLEGLNEHYAARYAGALAGDLDAALGRGAAPTEASMTWWVHNATGSKLLDDLGSEEVAEFYAKVAADSREKIEHIQTTRAWALAQG